MLIDTNVLIWLTKDNANAKKLLLNSDKKYISAVTYMEMLQGMNNKLEMQAFLKHFEQYNYEILPINEKISNEACRLVETYALSHTMELPDALIASTAIFYHQSLVTANVKDFQYIPNLDLQKFIS